ncbi:hypothetical protein [Desulfococcus multivorans]|uniref:Transposase n=1 Tax=Desulfococcus multivorans DSM 2059 TaxID=1121405 RepID=S7T801_DESML|nr:hypothetical protein [Desulfococcus multivorans]AOY57298.1 conserved uncharacterized protein [Desulfococcus multivorans]AQU99747.1 hypothetical protein B2D07_02445 [Desulfococcus multivorans]EPR33247.1 hypothetical protein dsmv_3503 [Desulfococcus multivorans DSM 2059]SKA21615.1 hypothetical protein SAMN02745446_03314 [Desulfococcus multivorans DSM 2059]
MPYSEKFKRKIVQNLTGPNAISVPALSKEVDVSQTTLPKWLRNAGVTPHPEYPNNDENWKVRLIEEGFMRRMWNGGGV